MVNPSHAESDDAVHLRQVQSLLVRHAPSVRAFVLGLTASTDLADDVMQEVFLRVSAKASDFEIGTNFTAWACGIARFVVLEEARRFKGRTLSLPADVIDHLADHFIEPQGLEQRVEVLRRCMKRLSPSARRILDLRYTQSLKSAQVAEQLGMRTQTVYVSLSRSRNALRACIEKHLKGAHHDA